MGRRARGGAPECPVHAGSHVVFDGQYGKAGHRRQRYRCYPSGSAARGQQFHRFVEPLPRQMAPGGCCEVCEREVRPHEGHPGARRYDYAARDVAAALIRVGGGSSYRGAAYAARREADRFRLDRAGREHRSEHGQLVADWVEVFAPVVFERFRPFAWPDTGSILLDHMTFRVKALKHDGLPKPGGEVAFNVFAAMGYENERPVFIRLEAFPDASTENWVRFLTGGALTGQPTRVVTDGHDGTMDAARHVWPDARLYRSEWHLMRSVEKKLITAKLHGDPKFMVHFRQAFINRNFWENFRVKVYRLHLPEVERQLDVIEPFIEECWRTRPDEKDRRANPITTGGLERRMKPVSDWLDGRAHLMTNKQRLDRLLMLMQLQLDGKASQAAYTRAIRDWLSIYDGRAATRRLVTDPAGALSLHDGIRPMPSDT